LEENLKRYILYTNIDQKLVNSLHGLLNCEIGGLECRVITGELLKMLLVHVLFD